MKKLENKVTLKVTAMVCSSVLGFISLIGVFWGTSGLKWIALGIFVLLIIVMMILASLGG